MSIAPAPDVTDASSVVVLNEKYGNKKKKVEISSAVAVGVLELL